MVHTSPDWPKRPKPPRLKVKLNVWQSSWNSCQERLRRKLLTCFALHISSRRVSLVSWNKANRPGLGEAGRHKNGTGFQAATVSPSYVENAFNRRSAVREGRRHHSHQDVEGGHGHQLHDPHQVHPGRAEEVCSLRNRCRYFFSLSLFWFSTSFSCERR